MKKFIISFLIALLIFSGIFFGLSGYLDSLEAKQSMDQLDESALGEGNKIEPVVDNELLFLLVGMDENQEDQHGYSRTDTIMLVKIDSKAHTIDIISIPRDSRIEINGKMDKVNHAHAYGGITLTMKSIRDFLNIDLDYFVKVNYEAVEDIVNAIGGVEVEVPFTIDMPTENAYIEEGTQLLNGHDALAFLRYRKGYVNGDLGRVGTQQKFMVDLVKQVAKPKNITKLPALIKTYYKDVETNLSLGHIINMVPAAMDFDSDKVNTHMLPGTDGYKNKISYYFPDEQQTKDLVRKVLPHYILQN